MSNLIQLAMKPNKILIALSLIVSVGLLTQCDKFVDPEPTQLSQEDSSALKKGGNDEPGISKGGEYGDLYIILRSLDPATDPVPGLGSGVPIMTLIEGEWYVQPIDEDGSTVELDDEGEVVDHDEAQEVEFGRLNIVRAPVSVLDQAFDEALKVLSPPNGTAEISLDFCGRLTSYYFNEDLGEYVTKTIDSPRESMAIYRTIMQDFGDERLSFLDELGDVDILDIAASSFAAGSDKTGIVDVDEVVYINGFMDCIGNNPIEHEYEFDYNGDRKEYYNFADPRNNGNPYVYDRVANYMTRYIQFQVWDNVYYPDDENGNSAGPVFSVLEIMEGLVVWRGIGDKPEFTYEMGELSNESVEGFVMAVDDAVQVLDFVHGESTVRFLPDHSE